MVEQKVSGMGAKSNRIDRNIVQRIQRDAKIQKASGGSYGERKTNTELASGALMAGGTTAAPTAEPQEIVRQPSHDIFAPGTSGNSLSHGADGGPGAGSEALTPQVDAINQGSALARAMFAINPTPQLRRIVEAYNEEGQ